MVEAHCESMDALVYELAALAEVEFEEAVAMATAGAVKLWQ